MKLAKRFLAIALVAVMLVSSCMIVDAASATIKTWTQLSTYTIDNAVTYKTYTVKGSSSNQSTTAHILEFNPKDGYVPMAFTGAAGDVLSVSEQYAAAVAQGYEVAGVINGSFFDMDRGSINQTLINEGRIISSDPNDQVGALATFDAEGGMTGYAYSVLHFDMVLDGRSITDAIGSVNKRYQYISNSFNSFTNRFMYYDKLVGTGGQHGFTSTSVSGYEIVCEKLDYTELAVGKTLKAKVVQVKSGRNYGATIPTSDNQFVLFAKSGTTMATYASSLYAGAQLSISTWESSSTDLMNNAYSAMSSCYALVKNGVDQCASQSNIAHKVNGYARPWTAFGQKADGSYVYFISTGEKMDLADVSAAMIKLGCTTVYRLDGGGSTAMYVNGKGTVYQQGRDVADVMLIVKKSSMDDPALTSELQSAVTLAKSLSAPTAEITSAIKEAEALLAKQYPAKGLVKASLSKLNSRALLSNLLAQAKAEPSANYTTEDYNILKSAISTAESAINNSNSTETQLKNAITGLTDALALSQYSVLSIGKSYTTQGGTPYTYWGSPANVCHDDKTRLTDGSKSNVNLFTSAYSAWQTTNSYIDDGAGGRYLKVVVDLGTAQTSNVYSVYTGAIVAAGISNPGFVSVWGLNSTSETPTLIGSCDVKYLESVNTPDGLVERNVFSLTATEGQKYRYIEYHIYPNQYGSSFLWIDEVEVACNSAILPEEPPVVTPPVGSYILGDVNGDSKLNATDYMMLKSIVLGNKLVTDLKDQSTAYARCDVKTDDKINATDYFLLKKNLLA